mmetsp:Transcript_20794/g.79745  ORF Transcript_20794/g.79745 Transcript_20794/m.79745 type:complete len:364 (+) Transcript_20794:1615-2706(+)
MPIIEYVVSKITASEAGGSGSFAPRVRRLITECGTRPSVVNPLNASSHWLMEVSFGQSTIVLFLIVAAAAMPTSVLPAPHGRTIMPDRARPLPNILARERDWYGRKPSGRVSSIASVGTPTRSSRKSYSSINGMGGCIRAHRARTTSTLSARISNRSTCPRCSASIRLVNAAGPLLDKVELAAAGRLGASAAALAAASRGRFDRGGTGLVLAGARAGREASTGSIRSMNAKRSSSESWVIESAEGTAHAGCAPSRLHDAGGAEGSSESSSSSLTSPDTLADTRERSEAKVARSPPAPSRPGLSCAGAVPTTPARPTLSTPSASSTPTRNPSLSTAADAKPAADASTRHSLTTGSAANERRRAE